MTYVHPATKFNSTIQDRNVLNALTNLTLTLERVNPIVSSREKVAFPFYYSIFNPGIKQSTGKLNIDKMSK
jgi:hypothetical protein